MRKDVGRGNVLYVHVTLAPSLAATGELKTKPTQHSVKELRGIGIQPDVIIVRSDQPVSDEVREKIALFTDVPAEAVIPAETAETIYEVPLLFENWGLGDLVVRDLGLAESAHPADLTAWRALVDRIKRPKRPLEIALVGKYIELPDAYLSVTEALRHAGWAQERSIGHPLGRLGGAHARELRRPSRRRGGRAGARRLRPSGHRRKGARRSLRAREPRALPRALPRAPVRRHRVRAGRCRGAGRELDRVRPVHQRARDRLHARSAERWRRRAARCGSASTRRGCLPGSKAHEAYGDEVIYERHRHRFEVNNEYRDALERSGMVLSGQSPDGRLVEIVELRDHPWFVASQFHPEFRSRPDRPHPLFSGFVKAAIIYAGGDQLGLESDDEGGIRTAIPVEAAAIRA